MGLQTILTRTACAAVALLVVVIILPAPKAFAAAADLADQPMFVTNNVPPNMMLVLSVEWPTGVVAAYNDNASAVPGGECSGRTPEGYGVCYYDTRRYLGYFDPERCYGYFQANGVVRNDKPDASRSLVIAKGEYFVPVANGSGTNKHQCSKAFSGNFLNWATMHAVDEFRFAMTGGDRVVDTGALTVVEKARHTGQGGYSQFPVKLVSKKNIGDVPGAGVENVSPFDLDKLYVRVTDSAAELNPWSDAGTRGRVFQMSKKSDFSGAETYTYLARVAVCNAAAVGGLEYSSNGDDYNPCMAYQNGYKPSGLIQKNATKMRFGIVSYPLRTSNQSDFDDHPKGVVRSRIKSVGPKFAVPVGGAKINPEAEWDEANGIYTENPDPAEAAASGVTQSGVVNYLNRSGKANGYMDHDTLGELYYAGLRSLRNLPPPAQYVKGLSKSAYDGFPIIKTQVDDGDEAASRSYRPIQYSCQRNSMVGIADTNTWTDVDLPGNKLKGINNSHPTGDEIKINDSSDEASNVDVTALTNKVGSLEGISETLGVTYQRGAEFNTFHAAGLAYWANVHDILVNDPSRPWTLGKQTAQTYWVDVRETQTAEVAVSGNKVNNQMWLAAKYGGFDDLNGDGKPSSDSTWHTNSDSFSDLVVGDVKKSGKRPDNYFTGDRPDAMIASLNSIFNAVLSKSLSSSGASLSTINFQNAGAGAYTVKFNSKDWSGDVLGNTISVDASGVPTVNNVWSAQAKLDNQAADTTFWNAGRLIATTNPALATVSKGVPFRLTELSDTQKTYLGATATAQQSLLNYLRGEKTNEDVSYRVRAHLLGDIVDSEATVVVGPDGTYKDELNPGYSAFTKIARASRIYVGANDGMLHAFSGDVSATQTDGGQEKWAYIPSLVLKGPSGTPAVDGLAARAQRTGFHHRYYVDQTPYVRDVDFSRTRGATAADSGDWHSLLVGGLGKGGKGYYAIDVTQPSDITTEATLAAKVLWEFSDEDMGFSFGRPVIAKTVRDGWVVILSSGYNNTDGANAEHRGKGFLYILNAKTGALIEKISTGEGSADSPSGFARPAAFIPDSADFTLDYVYGGDLNGNVWRFDLTGSPSSYPLPLKFATLKDQSGTIQPVTVEPKIEVGGNAKDRWVFIGTGKLLASADLASTTQQSFYAFRDGTRTRAYGSPAASNQTSLPTGGAFPITRTQMVKNSNLLLGYAKDLTHPMGWYYELISASEKITSAIIANEGVVSWTTYLPSEDPCSPGAASKTYAAEYDTGKSRITVDNATVEYFSSNSYLVKVQFIKDASGKIRAVLTTGDPSLEGGQIQALSGRFGRNYGMGVRINWREIAK